MPKVTAPLMSLQASGEIGMPLQYSTHRGLSIVRKKPLHQDPSTPAQQQARANFLLVSDFWSTWADAANLRADWKNVTYFGKSRRNGWNEFSSAALTALKTPGIKKMSMGFHWMQPRYMTIILRDLRGDDWHYESGEFFFSYSRNPRGPFEQILCLNGRTEVEAVWPSNVFSVGESIAGYLMHRSTTGVFSRRSGLIKFTVEPE
jgi:hypothetical protein